jgi:hypothetical protein
MDEITPTTVLFALQLLPFQILKAIVEEKRFEYAVYRLRSFYAFILHLLNDLDKYTETHRKGKNSVNMERVNSEVVPPSAKVAYNISERYKKFVHERIMHHSYADMTVFDFNATTYKREYCLFPYWLLLQMFIDCDEMPASLPVITPTLKHMRAMHTTAMYVTKNCCAFEMKRVEFLLTFPSQGMKHVYRDEIAKELSQQPNHTDMTPDLIHRLHNIGEYRAEAIDQYIAKQARIMLVRTLITLDVRIRLPSQYLSKRKNIYTYKRRKIINLTGESTTTNNNNNATVTTAAQSVKQTKNKTQKLKTIQVPTSPGGYTPNEKYKIYMETKKVHVSGDFSPPPPPLFDDDDDDAADSNDYTDLINSMDWRTANSMSTEKLNQLQLQLQPKPAVAVDDVIEDSHNDANANADADADAHTETHTDADVDVDANADTRKVNNGVDVDVGTASLTPTPQAPVPSTPLTQIDKDLVKNQLDALFDEALLDDVDNDENNNNNNNNKQSNRSQNQAQFDFDEFEKKNKPTIEEIEEAMQAALDVFKYDDLNLNK